MALSRGLQNVVDWTWQNRVNLMTLAVATGFPKGKTHMAQKNRAVAEVYTYLSGSIKGENFSIAQLKEFEATLRRKLVGHFPAFTGLGGSTKFVLQTGRSWDDLGKLNKFPAPRSWARGFIHVVKEGSDGKKCNERVYLNLKARTRANAFGAIVRKVWHLPGVLSAKVAGPAATKSDTVLIYCTDASTRIEVIKIVKKYQQKNQRYFDSELPTLVASVGLGIGHGAEPPSMHPIRRDSQTFEGVKTGQSFGLFRATLIFIALERTLFPEEMAAPDTSRHGLDLRNVDRANRRHGMQLDIGAQQREQANSVQAFGQKLEFEQRVEDVFRLAGLDPEHPELQGDEMLSGPLMKKFPSLPPLGPPPGPPPGGQ